MLSPAAYCKKSYTKQKPCSINDHARPLDKWEKLNEYVSHKDMSFFHPFQLIATNPASPWWQGVREGHAWRGNPPRVLYCAISGRYPVLIVVIGVSYCLLLFGCMFLVCIRYLWVYICWVMYFAVCFVQIYFLWSFIRSKKGVCCNPCKQGIVSFNFKL